MRRNWLCSDEILIDVAVQNMEVENYIIFSLHFRRVTRTQAGGGEEENIESTMLQAIERRPEDNYCCVSHDSLIKAAREVSRVTPRASASLSPDPPAWHIIRQTRLRHYRVSADSQHGHVNTGSSASSTGLVPK